jgi:hypothetical protein
MFAQLSWLRRLQLAVAVAAILFAIVLGVLALRTALGKDPALGTSARGTEQTTTQSTEPAGDAPAELTWEDDTSSEDSYDDDDGAASGGSWGDDSSAAQEPLTTRQS